jgi:hypothetical protein
MAEKPKGNLLYEILIVVLIVVLIGTILFPSRVWEKEEEMQRVCRTRMETVYRLEKLNIRKFNDFTHDISFLIDTLAADPYVAAELDSTVFWDGLVLQEDLKSLILQEAFPGKLADFILEKLENGLPAGHLGVWDGLNDKLLDALEQKLGETLEQLAENPDLDETVFDSGVIWPVLTGENRFWDVLENPDVERESLKRTISRRAIRAARRGTLVYELRDWKYYRMPFLNSMKEMIKRARRTDLWFDDAKDEWEVQKKEEWETAINQYSAAERDSLWEMEIQQRYWDRDKELLWKKDRSGLWGDEGKAWKEKNNEMLQVKVEQLWEVERKQKWFQDSLAVLQADSAKQAFRAAQDSLWRITLENLKETEYKDWKNDNRKTIDEFIWGIWKLERQVTWADSVKEVWLKEMNPQESEVWTKIKEEKWKIDRDDLWEDEKQKIAGKRSAIRHIDHSVNWINVLGEEEVRSIVSGLELPGPEGVWHRYVQEKKLAKKDDISQLADLGLSGIFYRSLLDSISQCPVARVPYWTNIIHDTTDTGIKKYLEMECPIQDTTDSPVAVHIDPLSGDTSMVDLHLSASSRILGGANIEKHGSIDRYEKKSWEKKGQ